MESQAYSQQAHTSKDTAGALGVAAAQCSSMPWMVCWGGARCGPLKLCSSTSRSASVTKHRLSSGAFGAAMMLVSSACTAAETGIESQLYCPANRKCMVAWACSMSLHRA